MATVVRDQNKELENARVRAEALGPLKAKIAESIPVKRRALWEKAQLGQCSPRQAIKSKCQECVGFEDVEVRIKECRVSMCPLLKFRPYQ